jgi:CheY-like chemotaxis protein
MPYPSVLRFFDNADDAILLMGGERRIIYSNHAASDLLNRSPNELSAFRLDQLVEQPATALQEGQEPHFAFMAYASAHTCPLCLQRPAAGPLWTRAVFQRFSADATYWILRLFPHHSLLSQSIKRSRGPIREISEAVQQINQLAADKWQQAPETLREALNSLSALTDELALRQEQDATDKPQDTKVPAGNAGRILYVDHLMSSHLLMQALCRTWHYELTSAFNGQEALDKMHENRYELVIIRLQMPLMDGYTTSRYIRSSLLVKNAEVPIVGLASEPQPQPAESAGVNEIIEQPLHAEKLHKLLQKYLA